MDFVIFLLLLVATIVWCIRGNGGACMGALILVFAWFEWTSDAPLPIRIGWFIISGAVYFWCVWSGWQIERYAGPILDRVKELHASRSSLTVDEFYNSFYKSEGIPREVVVKVRRIIQEEENLEDFGWARPEDRLHHDLGIGAIDGLDFAFIIRKIEKEFAIRIPVEEWGSVSTLDDLIRLVARYVQSGQSTN